MSSIPSPTLLASPPSLSSPIPTDIQETKSSHNENHHQSTQQQQQQTPKTTEYKSNFRPFDQYVYNEITDSFVKQKSGSATNSNYLLIESTSGTAGSNQDLHALSSISPALEVTSFEPHNGGQDQHYDVTKEPWYKEVLKRNEKANEYRFKSEVGHSSPLLKQAEGINTPNAVRLSNDELSAVSLIDEQLTSTGAHTAISPAPTHSDELSSKRSYNFTPHDYKRDHLIATMANNNNFKLPKEDQSHQQERSIAPRRVQATSSTSRAATSSARALTRAAASSRARSQSSRTPACSTTSSTKAESLSKSNQSSPIKSVTPRVSTTRTSLAPARSSAAKSNNVTATSATRAPARPSLSGTNGTSMRPSTTTTRRSPASSAVPTSRPPSATSKLAAGGTSTSTARATTASTTRPSIARPPTLTTASRSSAARTPSSGTTGTITITSNKARTSPVKKPTTQSSATRTTSRPTAGAPARNSSHRAPASRSGPTSAAATASTASNEPKSIKSKALADAGEKAAALAAAAAGAAAVATTAGTASIVASPPSESSKDLMSSASNEQEKLTSSLAEVTPQHADLRANANYYLDQEPNLIITTTETGNMLADEIARAEKAAQEEALRAQRELANQHQPSTDATSDLDAKPGAEMASPTRKSQQQEIEVAEDQSIAKTDLDNESCELVNGLTGGIVSAEDTYDHSEHDLSAQLIDSQQAVQLEDNRREQNEDNDDEEPYSLMPTTFNTARQEEPVATQQYIDAPFEEGEHRGAAHSQDGGSADAKKSGELQYGEAIQSNRIDQNKHVEFDLNVRTKSAELLPEPEVIESRSSQKLESSWPADDEGQYLAATNEDPSGTVGIGEQIDDLDDEPYEHLEAEAQDVHDEPQFANESIDKQAQSEHDGQIDDEFEIVGQEALDKDIDHEKRSEQQAVVTEREDLAPEGTKEATQVPDSDQNSEQKKELEPEKLAEEKKEDEPPRDDPDLPLAQEPLISKKIDSHKLTEETGTTSGPIEHMHDEELEEIIDLCSVSVPQLDDLKAISAGRLQSIDINNQQAPQSDENPVAANQAVGALIDRYDIGEQADLVNKASESHGHEDELLFHESGLSGNELLMNVADLVEAEARAKEEMTRKSELARQQSNSRSSLTLPQAGEILLSADQLNEQFAQSAGANSAPGATRPAQEQERKQQDEDNADAIVSAVHEVSSDLDATRGEHQREQQVALDAAQTRSTAASPCEDEEILSVQRLAALEQEQDSQSADDLVNFASLTSTQEQQQLKQHQSADEERRDPMSDDANDHQREPVSKESGGILEARSSTDLIGIDSGNSHGEHQSISTDRLHKSNNLLYDDLMDDDEQQKLSNHLTNSDDDVILAPRNTKEPLVDDCFSPQKVAIGSRYNEGAGLSSMAHEDEGPFGDAESAAGLADGSSAAMEAPTVAENRIELATSKSLMPELHAVGSTGFVAKLSGQRNGFDSDDDDDEQAFGLDPNADPIDVAATLSPSSSVAEEMLRLSRQASSASITTGGAAPKLAEELRSDKLTGDSFEKDADTYISNAASAAHVATQLSAAAGRVVDQVREAVPDEPILDVHANLVNNNNNENETTTTSAETDVTASDLVQRKDSSDLDGGNSDRKEEDEAAAAAAKQQHQDTGAGAGQLDDLALAGDRAVPTN